MNPFRVGPILTERAALRMPLPVNFMGSWAWVEKTGVSFAPAETFPAPHSGQESPCWSVGWEIATVRAPGN